eukprot:5266208-Pyramimonas_sp.AAC.1
MHNCRSNLLPAEPDRRLGAPRQPSAPSAQPNNGKAEMEVVCSAAGSAGTAVQGPAGAAAAAGSGSAVNAAESRA